MLPTQIVDGLKTLDGGPLSPRSTDWWCVDDLGGLLELELAAVSALFLLIADNACDAGSSGSTAAAVSSMLMSLSLSVLWWSPSDWELAPAKNLADSASESGSASGTTWDWDCLPCLPPLPLALPPCCDPRARSLVEFMISRQPPGVVDYQLSACSITHQQKTHHCKSHSKNKNMIIPSAYDKPRSTVASLNYWNDF